MSNALAIATVTETLRQGLDLQLGAVVPGAHVSAQRPDSANLPNPGVNIFLYQVAPNISWRNADLPTRTAGGALIRRPQAALDLFYLFTFYGNDAQLEQQRLLGGLVRILHASPALQRADISAVESSVAFLNSSNLSGQIELIRFGPINFSLEEWSKLWSVFLKTDYVLSVAYMASVVLIETDDTAPPPALPVLAPNIYVLPFQRPVITQITSAAGTGIPILPGSQIIIIGQNLLAAASPGSPPTGSVTTVLVGGMKLMPAVVSSTRLIVSLPSSLAAGAQTATVIQSLELGTPPVPHNAGFQSDAAAFVLSPLIRRSSPPGSYDISIQQNVGSPPTTTITIGIDPSVQPHQKALLE
jgi:hypothetical protein